MVAAIGAAVTIGSALIQADAADSASQAQQQASRESIDSREAGSERTLAQNQKQFDAQLALRKEEFNTQLTLRREQYGKFTELLKPWIDTGVDANTGQKNLIGLGGPDAQAAAIAQLKGGPEFGALQKTGQEAILSNASATGGLRGGNVQGALAQYDTSLLSKLINDQYARLGGLSTTGAAAATNLGGAAMGVVPGTPPGITPTPYTAPDNSVDINNMGAAEAGGILGAGKAVLGGIGGLTNAAGVFLGGGSNTVATTPAGVPMQGGFGGGPVFV